MIDINETNRNINIAQMAMSAMNMTGEKSGAQFEQWYDTIYGRIANVPKPTLTVVKGE